MDYLRGMEPLRTLPTYTFSAFGPQQKTANDVIWELIRTAVAIYIGNYLIPTYVGVSIHIAPGFVNAPMLLTISKTIVTSEAEGRASFR